MNDYSIIDKALDGDLESAEKVLKDGMHDLYDVMKLAKKDIDTEGLLIQKSGSKGIELSKNPSADVYLSTSQTFNKIIIDHTALKHKSKMNTNDESEQEKMNKDVEKKEKLNKTYESLKKLAKVLSNND